MRSPIPDGILPQGPALWTSLAGLATVAGVVISRYPLVGVPAVVAVFAAVRWRRLVGGVALFFAAVGMLSGLAAQARVDATASAWVRPGGAVLGFRVVEDTSSNRYSVAVGEASSLDGVAWNGPRLAIIGLDDAIDPGTTIVASGNLRSGTRRVRDEIVAGTFTIDAIESTTASGNPIVGVGNSVRRRVQSTYGGEMDTDGLVAGFLIGDTRFLPAHDVENLRRAGLAHYVAVSGSNVAIFLLGWWIVTAPLSIHPRLRAVVGIVGLGIFIVVTRWEPSVIRASAMAAVPLVGALASVPVDPWMALGVAVTVLLTVSGDLLWSVGFQLSLAATIGVLIGVAAARGRRPSWLWTPLVVTISAQLAVAPIILAVFGSMPLWAPIANLLAAPAVTGATVAGGISLVAGPVKPIADLLASIVLTVADLASRGPQLGVAGVVGATVVGTAVGHRSTRVLGVVVGFLAAVSMSGSASPWPVVPTATVLDVGQGDAILLQDPSGAAMLVDSGGDPAMIDLALRRHGVRRIDVAVVTHPDGDHIGAMVSVLTSIDVGTLWVSPYVARSDLLVATIEQARRRDVTVVEVASGVGMDLGRISIDVIAPKRRYASDNDGSIVLLATAGRSMLIPGDIEAVAQADLPALHPDVMVVPHHGSSSTDEGWLSDVVGETAIVSYGPNTFGHPDDGIMAVLAASGTNVRETAIEGDVSVSLSGNG